jgi:alpha-glucosidase (family GH31 glycosyl hydrolase)
MSVNMLLSLGVSGIVFGGCDIPGFYGEPSDDLWV